MSPQAPIILTREVTVEEQITLTPTQARALIAKHTSVNVAALSDDDLGEQIARLPVDVLRPVSERIDHDWSDWEQVIDFASLSSVFPSEPTFPSLERHRV